MYAIPSSYVDIATGWSRQRAVWGRNYQGVIDQIKDIEQSLPFPILGFDTDNGSGLLKLSPASLSDREGPADSVYPKPRL